MYTLKLNGAEVRSLPELREKFDLAAVMAAFQDGSLAEWLNACCYEREAERLEKLAPGGCLSALTKKAPDAGERENPSPETVRAVCEILGVDYGRYGLSPEERAAWERKRALLARYTDDLAVLSHALDAATNQAELAELLNAGRKTVWLCGGPFSVPIGRAGVHYVGVGGPKVETPYTEEQYRRAGITFECVDLPRTADPAAAEAAERAAERNGYDNFGEKHNALASAVHFAMKRDMVSIFCYLDTDASTVACGDYTSRSAAKQAGRRVVNRAYEDANAFFEPGSAHCLSGEMSERYARSIRKAEDIAGKLSPRCDGDAVLGGKLDAMTDLICGAEDALRARFDQELRDNTDYYRMYDKDYFLDKIEVIGTADDMDVFDSDLLNTVFRFIGEREFMVGGVLEAVSELGEDVNKHADTFFREAWNQYKEYCARIEEIAGEIGGALSGDELRQLGILVAQASA